MSSPETWLVAWDFSDASSRALAWALDHAAGRDVRVVLLHVLPPPVVGPPEAPSLGAVDADEVRAVEASMRAALAGAKVPTVVDLVVGASPGAAVLAAAQRLHASLVCLGTHGRGGVARWVLGSVADEVVRHAEVPVVTTR